MSATPIGLLTSDWHLEERTWADRPKIAGDAIESLKQIVTAAIENKLWIVAAGDLLDRKQNFSNIPEQLRKQLGRLAVEKCPLYFIQGQHERQERPWLKALHNWPIWLAAKSRGQRTAVIAPGGPLIYGIDWTPRGKLAEELSHVPDGADLLVMHQVSRELMGSIVTPELSADMLPNVPKLLIGDYHKTELIKATNGAGGPTEIISPGSTHMRAINEPHEKYYWLLYDDGSLEKKLIHTRPYLEFLVRHDDELEKLVFSIAAKLAMAGDAAMAHLPEELTIPLVRVTYADNLIGAYKRLRDAIGALGHLFVKVEMTAPVDRTEETLLTQAAEKFEAAGLVGCLPLLMDESEEAYAVARRLLECSDPDAMLAEIRGEFGLT